MSHFAKILFVLSLLLSCTYSMHAQDDLLQPKSRPTLVNDNAKVFSDSQRADLEQMLVAYNDSTSTQIAIITVKSLNGYAASDYAARLGEQWGIGQSGKDNGVVILIKPSLGHERGEVYIATGYGVEHILTDARVGRIIDDYMIPYLPDDYYAASKTAITVMMQMLAGEFVADPTEADIFIPILILVLFGVVFYFVVKNSKDDDDDWKNGGGNSGGRRRGPSYFPPIRGGFGGPFRGGSSGGGGFGGFGGGRFGGGGAGRSF